MPDNKWMDNNSHSKNIERKGMSKKNDNSMDSSKPIKVYYSSRSEAAFPSSDPKARSEWNDRRSPDMNPFSAKAHTENAMDSIAKMLGIKEPMSTQTFQSFPEKSDFVDHYGQGYDNTWGSPYDTKEAVERAIEGKDLRWDVKDWNWNNHKEISRQTYRLSKPWLNSWEGFDRAIEKGYGLLSKDIGEQFEANSKAIVTRGEEAQEFVLNNMETFKSDAVKVLPKDQQENLVHIFNKNIENWRKATKDLEVLTKNLNSAIKDAQDKHNIVYVEINYMDRHCDVHYHESVEIDIRKLPQIDVWTKSD